MAPVIHTDQEEQDFMNVLLSGFRSPATLSHVPPPHLTPTKPKASPAKFPRSLATPSSPRRTDSLISNTSSTSSATLVGEEDVAFLLEGAEDWDWDDMNSDFMSPRKKSPIKKLSPVKSRSGPSTSQVTRHQQQCTRCIVHGVSESWSESRLEKKLIVNTADDRERRVVILRDDWIETDVHVGDTVNIIGQFDRSCSSTPTIFITAKSNLLILHPDILLTATSLSGAPQCGRKPIVANLVRATIDTSPALVWGNILHEVMQSCLGEDRWDDRFTNEQISRVVHEMLPELLKIDVSAETAITEVKARAKGLKVFSQRYMSQIPNSDAVLTNTRSSNNQTSLLAISELLDVEEDIWSPTYGLRGKLDVSVQTVIEDQVFSFFAKSKLTTTKSSSGPMPFEIKTGRTVAGLEHRAQTMLYTLLMSERYGVQVDEGLLYYTQSEEVVRVPASRNEVRSLMVARNTMTSYMVRRTQNHHGHASNRETEDIEDAIKPFLPPTIDDEWICGKCYALDTCMLYRKAVENVEDDSSPIADMYNRKTSHLTPSQADFFKKWEALISLEEHDLIRFKKELWTMGASEREAHGRCFGSMVLDSSFRPTRDQSAKGGRIHQFTYRFTKKTWSSFLSPGSKSLLNGHMSAGDAITVSAEPTLLALARGFIIQLAPEEVIVGVDHVLDLASISAKIRTKSEDVFDDTVVFRLDKDELFGGMARIRYNLARLFYADGDTRRLELVVDLKTPVFTDEQHILERGLVKSAIQDMNPNQREAMRKVLSAEDYSLILGMPGTGKTTVIAAIIKVLVGMGKTVLLTSYTHSAVDTILLKLKDDADFGILRLGNLDKIHPDIHKYTLSARGIATTVKQLEHQVMTPPVVATTCLSIDHALFSRRRFDYCLVDEASQITLPTCLGPLRFADKFVLVGDHFQLPPLIRSRAARKGGLDVSLFRRLSEAHPHSVVDLTYQYRMNDDIMLLSNRLIYGGRLRCGSELVAQQSLILPNRNFVDELHTRVGTCCKRKSCWMERLLDPRCKAVFVDTDRVPARDSPVGGLVQNVTEAKLVYQLTEAFLGGGVREDQIGIISLYRQQIKVLSHLLQDRKDVEILTADRSQGRDKDCIIVSMVRSNDDGQIGDLVKDWRRVNVSFTRARSKLVIFGSRKTLEADELLSEFFKLMDEQGWIFELPPDAHEMHDVGRRLAATPEKRSASGIATAKENESGARPCKKARTTERVDEHHGLLKGRPILQDLVHDIK